MCPRAPCLLLLLATVASAQEGDWISRNFAGTPPERLVRSGSGRLRWVDLLGDRRLKHPERVRSVSVSGDGRTIASACGDGIVRLWERETGREIGEIALPARTVAFAPGGTALLVAGDGLSLLSLAPVMESRPLAGHEARVVDAVFTRDGRRIVSADEGGGVRVFDAATGACLRVLKAGSGLTCVAASADGSRIVAGNGAGTVWVFGPEGEPRSETIHPATILALAVSPDGRLLVSGAQDSGARVWELDTMKRLKDLERDRLPIGAIAWHPDGRRIVTGSWDGTWALDNTPEGTIRIWDPAKGELLATLATELWRIHAIAFSPDGSWIASGGDGRQVALWRTDGGERLVRHSGHTREVKAIAVDPAGRWCATSSADDTVRRWSPGASRALESPGQTVEALAVAPDGAWLVGAGLADRLHLWSGPDGASLRQIDCPEQGWAHGLAVGPGGAWIAAARGRRVETYDTARGTLLRAWIEERRHFESIACLSGSGLLACGADDGQVALFDPASGEKRVVLESGAPVRAVAASADGSALAAVAKDALRVWDAPAGTPRFEVERDANAVAFSPDGARLASGGKGRRLTICDARTGTETDSIPTDAEIRAAAWVGERLYAACADGTVCIYALSEKAASLK